MKDEKEYFLIDTEKSAVMMMRWRPLADHSKLELQHNDVVVRLS